VRFDKGSNTQPKAVENTKILVNAAVKAGVKRIVHISIANPSADSHLPYYWGKAANEKAVTDSGLSYAILRPTVLVGGGRHPHQQHRIPPAPFSFLLHPR
jgi:uncharacterized protein YbjT (DUF2867 family)